MKTKSTLLTALLACINLSASATANAPEPTNYAVQEVQQQKRTVTGIVKDAHGEAIIGASVVEKGTSNGVITDYDGNFSIELANGKELVISYVGYTTQTVNVAGKSSVNITLAEDNNVLDEVVAIGYGTSKKSDLTGSVLQVKADVIKSVTAGDPLQALQGRAPGLSVMTDNRPGESPTMRIRGSGSISAGNDPLYVVDGFPLMNGSISEINANDIATIEVLKDASATAIYGSRGANGVIMITTKTGAKDSKNLSFNATYGIQMPGRKIEPMTHDQFVDFINAAYEYSKGSPVYSNSNPAPDIYTDWQDEILKSTAPVQDYNVSFDGQQGDTRYMLSAGMFSQDGLLPSAYYRKYTLHTNLEHKFNKHLTVGTHLQYGNSKKRRSDSGQGGGLSYIWRAGWPTLPVYNADGSYALPRDNDQISGYFSDDNRWNPLANYDEIEHYTYVSRLFGDLYAEIQILPNLKFRTNFGLDISNDRTYDYSSTKMTWGTGLGSGGNGYDKQVSQITENVLTFDDRWGDHHLTATAVYSWQKYTYENMAMTAKGFQNDETGAWDMTLGDRSTVNYNSTKYDNKLISYTGRISYSFLDRYLLTATARYDGSSRFGQNNKWGFFPSVGFGWRVSEEPFIKNIQAISNLKIRGSWGITGNQEIGNYKSLAQLVATTSVYNNGELKGFRETIGNGDLKWERTQQLDLGIDLSLWNRLNLTIDYYSRATSDLLYQVPIPSTSGFSTMLSNIGKVSNKGIEITLGGLIVDNKDFRFDASVNFSKNTNKISELYNGVEKITVTSGLGISKYLIVGDPLTAIYGLKSEGIITSQEQLEAYRKIVPTANMGEEMYADLDGDGSITAKDEYHIGNTEPDLFYGIQLGFEYKKLKLNILGQGTGNFAFTGTTMSDWTVAQSTIHGYGDNFNYLLAGENQTDNRNYIPSKYAYERMWSESNPNGTFPRAGAQNMHNSDRTNGGMRYFMIKSIALSYDFGANPFGNKLKGIKGLSATLNMQNFITFANHRGYNPENGDISNPWVKTISLGINAKF